MARKGRIDRVSKITLADDEKEFIGNVVEGTKSSITEQHKPIKKEAESYAKKLSTRPRKCSI